MVFLCDPEEKLEVEITLWNDKSDIRFEKFPHMLKGVVVTSYRGTLPPTQTTGSTRSSPTSSSA